MCQSAQKSWWAEAGVVIPSKSASGSSCRSPRLVGIHGRCRPNRGKIGSKCGLDPSWAAIMNWERCAWRPFRGEAHNTVQRVTC